MRSSRLVSGIVSLCLVLVAVLLFSSLGLCQESAVPKTVKSHEGKTLKLVWNDEFTGVGLPDPAKWGYEHGFVRNNEAQYYTKERSKNAYQKDGRLIIESFKEHFEENGRTAEYTSASVTTEGRASWTYGRIEVAAKLPRGRGSWPAIWMLGTNIRQFGWPTCGEIDIMEYVGFNPSQVHATVHAKGAKAGHTSKGGFLRIDGVEDRFAVYAVEWSKDQMDFYVDDQHVITYKKGDRDVQPWPFDLPHYLILNTAIGGAWGGAKGIDDSIFPCKFEIDYVRVYQ